MTESINKKIRQVVGVVPFDPHNQLICIVSSRKHPKEWVLPKGGWEKGESPGEGAAREAWEEAGIKGEIGDKLGDWPHDHFDAEGTSKGHFTFFTFKVTKVFDDWPEKDERKRKWVKPSEAADLVRWKYMKKAINAFEKF